MAFTGIAALASAVSTGAAVTAGMVLAAVTEVGLALTVVGAVTGDKNLMKIGGAMSLIGGVGGMIAGAVSGATGAGIAAAETGLSEAATSAALDAASAEAASAFGGAAGAEASTASLVAEMEGAAAGGLDLAGAAAAVPEGIVGSSLTTPAAEMAQASQQALQVAPTASSATDIVTPTAPEAPLGAQGPATPYDNPTDARLAGGTQASPSNAPEAAGSFFGKLTTFAEKNKQLFSSGLQLVGGAMKGANDRSMWDEKMALERQRLKQSSYGNQVANFAPQGIVQGARA